MYQALCIKLSLLTDDAEDVVGGDDEHEENEEDEAERVD